MPPLSLKGRRKILKTFFIFFNPTFLNTDVNCFVEVTNGFEFRIENARLACVVVLRPRACVHGIYIFFARIARTQAPCTPQTSSWDVDVEVMCSCGWMQLAVLLVLLLRIGNLLRETFLSCDHFPPSTSLPSADLSLLQVYPIRHLLIQHLGDQANLYLNLWRLIWSRIESYL